MHWPCNGYLSRVNPASRVKRRGLQAGIGPKMTGTEQKTGAQRVQKQNVHKTHWRTGSSS